MIERGLLGEKTGQGILQARGRGDILVLDPATLTYRPKQPAKLASLDAVRNIEDVGERTRVLFTGKDKVGDFLRETLGSTILYAARVAPEIAHSIDDVDRAMKWGFGWELGPFETSDAIGINPRFRAGALPIAPGLEILKAAKDRSPSCAATPAQASSISATACWPSSSTRR